AGAPAAIDDNASTEEDVPVAINVTANDSDADGDLDEASVTVVTAPAFGDANLAGDGIVEYSPTADFHGTDSFEYEVCDARGRCDTATVSIVVTSVADAPVAADDSASTDEGVAIDVDVLANDIDVDGDLLSIESVGEALDGQVTVVDGVVRYMPLPDFFGVDEFPYQVCDGTGLCDSGVVTVTVAAMNDAPIAVNDATATLEDTSVEIDVLANDSDVDGNLERSTLVVTVLPVDSTVEVVGFAIRFTPGPDFFGVDEFTYQVCDGLGLCDSAAVTVSVEAVNDAPVAVDDAVSTLEDTSVDIDVLENDGDVDGDDLTVAVVGTAANGLAELVGGVVRFTPPADWSGLVEFTYEICDTTALCDSASVTVEVRPVNDAPDALDDNAAVEEDGLAVVDVLANDRDPDGDPLVIGSVTSPANGSAQVSAGQVRYAPTRNWCGTDVFEYSITDPDGLPSSARVTVVVECIADAPTALDDEETLDEDQTIRVDVLANDSDPEGDLDPSSLRIATEPQAGVAVVQDGGIEFTPVLNSVGADSFAYEVCDVTGLCAAATVRLDVTSVPDAPVAMDDTAVTGEDVAVVVDVLANDTDADNDLDPSTTRVVNEPQAGSVGVQADGSLVYEPAPDWHGDVAFSYAVCDETGLCAEASVLVAVAPVNDAPEAKDDDAVTDEDTVLLISPLANDSDVDADDLSVRLLADPSHGAVELVSDSQVRYTPDADFHGTDQFTYESCDPAGLCASAQVMVVVLPINDAPSGRVDAFSGGSAAPLVVPVPGVLTNDVDVDSETLVAAVVELPENGVLELAENGGFTYTPLAGTCGLDRFTYTVSDGLATSSPTSAEIDVSCPDESPVAVDDAVITPEDVAITIDVLANDSDDGGLDVESLRTVADPSTGTAVVVGAAIRYTPELDANGFDQFAYEVCDSV
ncbi:MAG: Ig-like domain-containing protein, partial [Acidimicrobiia bacterium]